MDKRIEKAALDPRLARAMRAMIGMANGQLSVEPYITDRYWSVYSTMSGKPHEYMVEKFDDGCWACNCPDYQKRHQECKHILAVKLISEGHV